MFRLPQGASKRLFLLVLRAEPGLDVNYNLDKPTWFAMATITVPCCSLPPRSLDGWPGPRGRYRVCCWRGSFFGFFVIFDAYILILLGIVCFSLSVKCRD